MKYDSLDTLCWRQTPCENDPDHAEKHRFAEKHQLKLHDQESVRMTQKPCLENLKL